MDVDEDRTRASANENEDEREPPSLTRGREAIERSLRQQIYVDRFPRATAGAPIPDSNASGHRDETDGVRESNPYAPFKSRMDWEFARWAKLRGPGSTAITELLGIAGVSINLHLYPTHALMGVSRSYNSSEKHYSYHTRTPAS